MRDHLRALGVVSVIALVIALIALAPKVFAWVLLAVMACILYWAIYVLLRRSV